MDIVEQSIENAKANAIQNDIHNAEFFCGDAGIIASQLAKNGLSPTVITIDPARKGCDSLAINTILAMNPQRRVMISCNPATAARDCKEFQSLGYVVEKIQPVDMFPCTAHVETCCLLERKIINNNEIEYMHVDYEPEDAEYLRGIKGSATYAEIKAWIKEQYNVSVSSLYIAQVKGELGFEKRDNYNKGAEGHRVPNCPEEKKKLILEAFKHFKMI